MLVQCFLSCKPNVPCASVWCISHLAPRTIFTKLFFFSFHSTFVHMAKLGISFRSLSTHWRSHLALLLIRFCAILAITNLIRIIMNGTRKLTTTTTATKMLTKKIKLKKKSARIKWVHSTNPQRERHMELIYSDTQNRHQQHHFGLVLGFCRRCCCFFLQLFPLFCLIWMWSALLHEKKNKQLPLNFFSWFYA